MLLAVLASLRVFPADMNVTRLTLPHFAAATVNAVFSYDDHQLLIAGTFKNQRVVRYVGLREILSHFQLLIKLFSRADGVRCGFS